MKILSRIFGALCDTYKVTKIKYRSDIQWLRGFSVLAVLLFHISADFAPNGYLGVNSFFVISGFVVGPIINDVIRFKQEQNRIIKFYLKRFFRLAPMFSLTISIALILFFLFSPISDHKRISGQTLFSLALIGNLGAYKFGNDYFHPQPNPLIHLWSLATEEQIYIILPIIFLLATNFCFKNRFLRHKSIYLYGIISGVSIIIHFLLLRSPKFLSKIGVEDVSALLFYLPTSHIWEFSAGAVLAQFQIKRANKNRLSPPFHAFCFYVILGVVFFSKIELNPIGPLVAVLLAVIFLHIGFYNNVSASIQNLFIWLGDRSYSIYLIHLPILYLFLTSPYLLKLGHGFKIIIAVALILLLSNLGFKSVEKVIRSKNLYKETLNLRIFFLIVGLIFVPLLLALAMQSVGGKSFVEKNSKIPVKAWTVDKSCAVLSSELCKYPKINSLGKTLLVGNSHGGAISRSFINVAWLNNYSADTFLASGCPFISEKFVKSKSLGDINLTEIFFKHKEKPFYCFDYLKKVKVLVESGEYDYVFIGTSSSGNLSESHSVAQSVIDMSKSRSKLIFVGLTPEFGASVRFSSTIFQTYASKADVPITDVTTESKQEDLYLKNYFSRSKVTYLSTFPVFCSTLFCRVFYKENYLYTDSNHLSLYGAKLLERVLAYPYN